jgi:hypothetical protein
MNVRDKNLMNEMQLLKLHLVTLQYNCSLTVIKVLNHKQK